jgi:hypothetical protein
MAKDFPVEMEQTIDGKKVIILALTQDQLDVFKAAGWKEKKEGEK